MPVKNVVRVRPFNGIEEKVNSNRDEGSSTIIKDDVRSEKTFAFVYSFSLIMHFYM